MPARLAAGHETLAEAIRSGALARGDELPSITELSALQGIGTGVVRHALETLVADGLIVVRHGQTAIVAGEHRLRRSPRPESVPRRVTTAAGLGAGRTSVTR